MTSQGKILILLCDGVADRPVGELDGKTPLEAARTPNFDRLARRGENGILDPVAPGVRPGSDTAHLALLGYDPYEYYTGRGPFEALGVGMDVRPGDVAFRCNFATVEERDGELVVIDRRAGRITEGTAELVAPLNGVELDGVKCFIKESTAHRAALVLRGDGLGAAVSDVDPHEEGAAVARAAGPTPEDEKTAAVVNKFVALSYETLKGHAVNDERARRNLPPANIILPRGAGLAPHIPRVTELYDLTAAAVVEVGLIRGIARYCGLDVVPLPEAVNGGLDTDLGAFMAATAEAVGKYDLVLANVKGPDVAGHDGDAAAKVAVIERIDAAAAPLLDGLPAGCHVAILGDHATPVAVRDHSGDPVPVLFWGPGVRTDAVETFGERPAAVGGAGRLRGRDLLPILLNLAGRAEKFGA
ncbi:MAG TPA: 2,3-bisphosphoglycerate-independent phosphoglycerate mutase [bacterium]|nr:2,3-bisphosphoglycerate-independent phosphoglycerate mutase [bacterium]